MTTTTLSLEIDYAHEHNGWIDCTLTVDGKSHHLSASGAVPPFLSLMYFIKAAAGYNLSHSFYWSEEGFGAHFDVAAVAEDSPLVHLKIIHEMDEKVETWIDADIEREIIVQAFLPPLVDFAQNYELVDRRWEFPRRTVENILAATQKGLPLRPDPHSPKHADFIIYPSYDLITEDCISIQLWVDDSFWFHFNLQDTDPFWPDLVGFLEKVASGNFSAELRHSQDMRLSLLGALMPAVNEMGFERKRRFVVSASDQPENFLLQHYFTEWQSESEVLLKTELINRQQFTRSFTGSFGDFLRDYYQISVDGNGKTFDLRTLSVEKLGHP